MATTKGTATALYALSKRVGFMEASRVLTFMMQWADAMRANDWQSIRVEDYAHHWRYSAAKGFRDQQKFRKAFAGEETPTRLVLEAKAQLEKNRETVDADAIAATILMRPA
jgi:hypothetical protein